jgi:hypothetical protein
LWDGGGESCVLGLCGRVPSSPWARDRRSRGRQRRNDRRQPTSPLRPPHGHRDDRHSLSRSPAASGARPRLAVERANRAARGSECKGESKRFLGVAEPEGQEAFAALAFGGGRSHARTAERVARTAERVGSEATSYNALGPAALSVRATHPPHTHPSAPRSPRRCSASDPTSPEACPVGVLVPVLRRALRHRGPAAGAGRGRRGPGLPRTGQVNPGRE